MYIKFFLLKNFDKISISWRFFKKCINLINNISHVVITYYIKDIRKLIFPFHFISVGFNILTNLIFISLYESSEVDNMFYNTKPFFTLLFPNFSIKCKYIHDTRYFQTGSLKKSRLRERKILRDHILGLSISLSIFASQIRLDLKKKIASAIIHAAVASLSLDILSARPRQIHAYWFYLLKEVAILKERYTGCPYDLDFLDEIFNIIVERRQRMILALLISWVEKLYQLCSLEWNYIYF